MSGESEGAEITHTYDEPVELRFTYTEAEQVRAARLYYDATMHLKRDAAISAAILVLGIYATTVAGYRSVGLMLVGLAALVLLFMGYVYFVRPRQMYRNDPKLRNEFHLVFSDSGIQFRTKDIDSRLGWDLYHAAYRDRELIILQHGKNTMTVLPLRAFAGESDVRRFEEMAARHITNVWF